MIPSPSPTPPLRRLAAAALACLAACTVPAAAHAQAQKYDKVALERAVAAGEPVVVHFCSGWNATCQLQQPAVQQVLQELPMRPVRYYPVDYDRERLLRGALGVTQQATFVVFKGGSEVGRSTGQTSRTEIRELFGKALPGNEWLESSKPAASAPKRGRFAGASAPAVDRGTAAETPFTPFSTNLGKRP